MKCFLIVIFSMLGYAVPGQNYFVKKDLRSEWKVYSKNSYAPPNSKDKNHYKAIYFSIPRYVYKGDRLIIESDRVVSVFINGVLISTEERKLSFPLDSLFEQSEIDELTVSLYQKDGLLLKSLITTIVSDIDVNLSDSGPLPRTPYDIGNFISITSLLLIIFFVFLLRFNPKLTFDYFSFPRMLMLRENDDSQMFSRIGSSANVLFYLFTSLLSGFIISLLINTGSIEYTSEFDGFIRKFIDWLFLSGLVFGLLFMKAIVISLFTRLFGVKEISVIQFTNFVRLLLVLTLLFFSLNALLAIFGVDIFRELSFLRTVAFWILGGWLILIFLKLGRRVSFSGFHLFSYICATELIPSLIIFKILYE